MVRGRGRGSRTQGPTRGNEGRERGGRRARGRGGRRGSVRTRGGLVLTDDRAAELTQQRRDREIGLEVSLLL